jgi:transposase-like protein
MSLILSGILTLLQHIDSFPKQPELYRPQRCPYCSNAIVWNHGCYTRKPGRGSIENDALNPVPIPRYYCPDCHKTCSMLPECIPPRSWYLWQVRQIVFMSLMTGTSARQTAKSNGSQVSEWTVHRWWRRFKECFSLYSFHLQAHFPWLGRHVEFTDFWSNWLKIYPLSTAMRIINGEGEVVP